MLLAGACFVKGLDERQDYLRLWHGLWHCFVGLSGFFSWQSIDNDDIQKVEAKHLLADLKEFLTRRKHMD